MPGAKLEQALQAALVAARKAQDKDRTLLLGTIIAAVKNHRIELGRDLTDEDVVTVLRRGVKQRQESVDQFRKAGRDTMADREESEISALKEFLPPEIGLRKSDRRFVR